MLRRAVPVPAPGQDSPHVGDQTQNKTQFQQYSVRLESHTSTDRPVFQPGEPVFVRTVFLDALTHLPPQRQFKFEAVVKSARDITVFSHQGETSAGGVASFVWNTPQTAAGGMYKVKVVGQNLEENVSVTSSFREFELRKYRNKRVKGNIVFERQGYCAGDTVHGHITIERSEGGSFANISATLHASVDGVDCTPLEKTSASARLPIPLEISPAGFAKFGFVLPPVCNSDQGSVTVTVADGDQVEAITAPIPIVARKAAISLYPEGGELVEGLPTRIYFQAWTNSGDPIDSFQAQVEDSNGTVVVQSISAAHEGRGVFTLHPKAGESYRLKPTQPASLDAIPLPVVLNQSSSTAAGQASAAVVLSVMESVVKPAQSFQVTVRSCYSLVVTVQLCRREVVLHSVPLEIPVRQSLAVRVSVTKLPGET